MKTHCGKGGKRKRQVNDVNISFWAGKNKIIEDRRWRIENGKSRIEDRGSEVRNERGKDAKSSLTI
jgi:hypothetical protein